MSAGRGRDLHANGPAGLESGSGAGQGGEQFLWWLSWGVVSEAIRFPPRLRGRPPLVSHLKS